MKSKKQKETHQQPHTESKKLAPFCCLDDRCKLINSLPNDPNDNQRKLNHQNPITIQCLSCYGYFHNYSCGKSGCCKKCESKGSSNVEVVAGVDDNGGTSK